MGTISTLLLLLAIYILVVYVTRRKKVSELRFKKPIKPPTQKRRPLPSPTKPALHSPFLIFNQIEPEEKRTVSKGAQVTENVFVHSGTVGVFQNGQLINKVERGFTTHSGFELLGIKINVKREALEETVVSPLPEGDPRLNLIIFEKTLIVPLLRYFHFYSLVLELEQMQCDAPFDFLLEVGSFETTSLQAGESLSLDGIWWVKSGEIDICGCKFGSGSCVGFTGLFFHSCRDVFTATASTDCTIYTLSYTQIPSQSPALFISSIDTSLLSPILFTFSASIQWLRLYPYATLFCADTPCNAVYLLGDTELGEPEALLGAPHPSEYVAEKIEDAVRIPSLLLEKAFALDPSFNRRFILKIFNKKGSERKTRKNRGLVSDYQHRVDPPFNPNVAPHPRGFQKQSKILLITPAGRECTDFLGRLQRTLLAKSVTVKSRELFVVSGGSTAGLGELLISEHLFRLKEKYKIVVVYLENEWSKMLKLCSMICDVIYATGRELVPNRIDRDNVEFVQLHERREMGTRPFFKKLLSRGSSDDESEGESEEEEDVQFPAYRRIHHVLCPDEDGHCMRDFERLARCLLGERIGLVLGGGGARGFAHIGVIQALEEENIPIDCIGGTSMGAFVGALYSQHLSFTELYTKARRFSKACASTVNFLLDLTYPYVSLFTGSSFTRALRSLFEHSKIQNLWIEFYCVTTNLLECSESIHTSGSVWKWLRASMSICGYLPPFVVNGRYYVDGAYVNNVPADVMREMDVQTVIAVDVADEGDRSIDPYDSKSGLVLLFKRFFTSKKYLSLKSLQYRLAFLSTQQKIRSLDEEILLIRPPLNGYQTTDFTNFDEIVACGYASAKEAVMKWRREGVIGCTKRKTRRFSI